jgi:hypothetical protein
VSRRPTKVGAQGHRRFAVGEDAAQSQFVPVAVLGETAGECSMPGRAAAAAAQIAEDVRAGDRAAFGEGFVVHGHERPSPRTAVK